ncbi:MAG: hypothetical protein LBJ35_00050 [Spirochaetaceae bacterium]|jgi:hypothetical protein|nr:hypothetical protein [Spirochaetaceae bacterium]
MKKNIISFIGILAMALVFGLAAVSCSDDSGGGGGGGGGGGIPSELVGKWYASTSTTTPLFEITSGNKFILGGADYDVSVSDKTVTVKQGSTLVGTFDYSISGNKMTPSNGTVAFAGLNYTLTKQ